MDEVVIMIRGKKHWLWRAIEAKGDVLDILVQSRRNAKAAKRFFQRLTNRFGEPRVVITDKLRSYIKPIKSLAPNADHRVHKGLNNAIEVSHRPTEPPQLNWSTPMFRKRRTTNGEQATEARRDCLEVAAG